MTLRRKWHLRRGSAPAKREAAAFAQAVALRRPVEFRTAAGEPGARPIGERCAALAEACGRRVEASGNGRGRPVMDAPRFGLAIVGDEILSGKRADKHLAKVIELLGQRGLALAWAHYAGDDRSALIEFYRRTFAGDDVVFSCGGIGSTPDDHTRQAAAAALGVPLVLHPEAERLIAQRCADMAREGRGSADMTLPENRQRLTMGEFPQGAAIIPNAFNRIPGFSIRGHWFVPGFPVMAWPMIEWVLDTHYRAVFGSGVTVERSLIVYETAESALVPLMQDLERRFAGVRAFSLPSVGDGSDGRIARRHIELGVKGAAGPVDDAFDAMRAAIAAMGVEHSTAP
jgi:molybdopterin-biosynthesis enzyme MoeA-like protein